MREMRRRMPHADRIGHPDGFQHLGLSRQQILRRARVVEFKIDDRAGQILDRRETLIEVARREKLPDQGIRYRFAGFGMDGEFRKDLRRLEPMFEQLAGQLDEIPGDGGARHSFIGDIGQHRVQRVAEFVEKRPRVVERKQARAVLGGLGEIAYVHGDRPHLASQLALAAE